MEEVKKLRAERQVADALNMRNGPKTTAIHNLPLNSPILVWREGPTGQPGYWSGPYNLQQSTAIYGNLQQSTAIYGNLPVPVTLPNTITTYTVTTRMEGKKSAYIDFQIV